MTTWDRNSEGAWRATWINSTGHLCWRLFYGYSKRDAMRLLTQYKRNG